jgi:ketosteroid isomerase-like protein
MWVETAGAAETAETVLIRQTLDKDRVGRRRGDVDLIRSSYAENFVAYSGNGLADPVGWTVLHEDPDAHTEALAADLAAHRYDTVRTVLFLTVLENMAIGAVVDSGDVIDRSSQASRPFRDKSLWSFRKIEDRWLAQSMVQALGDSAAGPFSGPPSPSSPEIEQFLIDDAAAWNEGSHGAIAGSFDPDSRILDAAKKFDPAGWVMLFTGIPEYSDWLDSRMQVVDYELKREILHTSIGAGGIEALAVAHEKLTARHQLGAAVHSTERTVVWTLSKRTGSWLVTSLLLNSRRQ